jgi:hypothetical protein
VDSSSSGGSQKMLSICTVSVVVPEAGKICCLFSLCRTVVPEEGNRCCLFSLCRTLVPEEGKGCCLFVLCRLQNCCF